MVLLLVFKLVINSEVFLSRIVANEFHFCNSSSALGDTILEIRIANEAIIAILNFCSYNLMGSESGIEGISKQILN